MSPLQGSCSPAGRCGEEPEGLVRMPVPPPDLQAHQYLLTDAAFLQLRSVHTKIWEVQNKGSRRTQWVWHSEFHAFACLICSVVSCLSCQDNHFSWASVLGLQFSSLQSLSCVRLFVTPWIAACQASLSITNSQSLLKLMSFESVMPSYHLILCHPLLLPSSIFPSIRVFSNESVLCIRWPKYWSFSFNISPSNEYSGLISFSIDWLDLLAVQGTLKSLL